MNFNIEEMFSNSPTELKEGAVKHNRAIKRVRKAVEQSNLWKSELEMANACLDSTQKEFDSLLNRWDQDTNSLKPKLEELAHENQSK